MTIQEFLADISRRFLEERNVYRYKMKKISDMTDGEIITACHFYCESNGLNEEWKQYRESEEMKYNYCPYLEKFIDNESCINLQMIGDGINPLSENHPRVENAEVLKNLCNGCINRLPF